MELRVEDSGRGLLTLDGYPTSPAIYAQGQRFSQKSQETPVRYNLEIPFSMYLNYCISFMRWRALRRELSSRFMPLRPELSEIQSEGIGTE
jgi:hypothetical protein